jgi:hypothetical protein
MTDKGSWRFILDKPGSGDFETVCIGSFRTERMCAKAAGLLLAERGTGWRATIEWIADVDTAGQSECRN